MIQPVKDRPMNLQHKLLLTWMLISGVLLVGISAAFYFNLIQHIIANDISLISVAIMIMFVFMVVFLGKKTRELSYELNIAYEVENTIKNIKSKPLSYKIDDKNQVLVNDSPLPKCMLTDHIRNLIIKSQQGSHYINQRILIEEFSESLHDKTSVSWMVTDKMTNLGLLGTAIGFAVALTALFGITNFDFAAMKAILSDVAIGMSIALYTTITALVASIPLKLKTFLIESNNNKLVSLTTKLTEVYVLPALERENDKIKISEE